MKKKGKALVSTLMAALLLALLPGSSLLTAHAAEAKTYSVKFIGGSINDWRYVEGNKFEDDAYHRELYYLNQELKDGDTVVVYGGDTDPTRELHLTAVRLENLTVAQNTTAIIFTGGVKDCYILGGAFAAINGDVTNAYLYDSVTCTFNNNVLDMVLTFADTRSSNISCAGTVGCFRTDSTNGAAGAIFYDIPANCMSMVDGTYQITRYSPTASEAYLAAKNDSTAAPAEAPAQSTDTVQTPATDAAEYDEVPKTGDFNAAVPLVCAAVLLFAGSCYLYRKPEN